MPREGLNSVFLQPLLSGGGGLWETADVEGGHFIIESSDWSAAMFGWVVDVKTLFSQQKTKLLRGGKRQIKK